MRVPRIFYGWWIVASFFLTLFLGAGIIATHSVFFKPISAEFGWSRTALSAVLSVNLLIGGLSAPFWGRLVDRRGSRAVVPVGVMIVGVSLLLLSTMGTMWQAYLFYMVLAVGGGGMSLVPISSTLSQWFARHRGLAIGVTLAGSGVGGLVMAPLAGLLLEAVGWRGGYRFYALMFLLVAIPVLVLVLRHRPQDMGLLPDGDDPNGASAEGDGGLLADAVQAPALNLKAAIKTRTFWLLAVGFMLPMFAGRALMMHLVPIMTDAKVSPGIAAAAFGVILGLSPIGKIAFGYAADRFSKRHIFALCYGIGALGMLCLVGLEFIGPVAVGGFILIFGCSYGGGIALAPLLIGECFGTAAIGEIFGVLGLTAMLGGALGPIFAGWTYDTMANYHVAFIVFVGAQLLGVAAILRCRPAVGERAEHGGV
jgi:MFS family permease